MSRLNALSGPHHVIVTDAGSNYYIGGQVFTFDRGQREITSGAFAAMGLSIPLAIGCAVAQPDAQILAVTGDGSLELNIQELKTVSHYDFNIKIFVINNGGYVSMKKWQDDYFEGRRIDDAESTGVGTLNLRNIAQAFDMRYSCIDDFATIDDKLWEIMSDDSSLFVEVVTDNEQKIINA
jgi:acetolactate synthase-1/2/3 large subunit